MSLAIMSLIMRAATTVAILGSAILTGCFDSNVPGEPPVERSAELADLSDADYEALCEWLAELDGYYASPRLPPPECDGFTRSPLTDDLHRLPPDTRGASGLSRHRW